MGNEINGVPQEITDQCDLAVIMPMLGVKKSLNVSVCGGVMMYNLIDKMNKRKKHKRKFNSKKSLNS